MKLNITHNFDVLRNVGSVTVEVADVKADKFPMFIQNIGTVSQRVAEAITGGKAVPQQEPPPDNVTPIKPNINGASTGDDPSYGQK